MSQLMDNLQVTGLSCQVARQLLRTNGYNDLPSQQKANNFTILLRILAEPMLLLLVGSGTLYFFMGEASDALILLSCVLVVIGITFFQERRTEKTLEALRHLSSPRALVIRDGLQIRIPGREVVVGDYIIIREGDRVPADATVVSCQNLAVDESLLTGESFQVRKTVWDGHQSPTPPGGDDLPFVFSGTMVVSGRGIVCATSTGPATQIGKIGKSLNSIKITPTRLYQETQKIVRTMAIIGFSLCMVVVWVYLFRRGDLIQGLLAGLTLSMSMLPEEFPVVLLIFMTMGAWRISRHHVLTRRADTIETLGAATVLCTDKTGTLTLNKMELTSLYANGSFYEVSRFASTELPSKFHQLLDFAMLASQVDPFDPIEKEIFKKGQSYLRDTANIHSGWQLIREYPLSKHILAMTHVWKTATNRDYIVASKGAPEEIIGLCHLPKSKKAEVLRTVTEMSAKGLRVLGVARATSPIAKLPSTQHDFRFDFVGLVGFIDPPRSTAAAAIREAYSAGIRVIMITGDFAGTAQFIAQKIGIKDFHNVITGPQLAKMDHLTLREKIKTTNVFARVVPEQKLLLVNALKANGETVAMTGDGVNDAPALKSANIGIAMGQRGTDVAREASSLVLLNDDFSSIVTAVRLGRRIYDNLRRAMGYILTVHFPIAGIAILPLFFDLPIVLLPAHIAFLELLIDPACSVVFEAEDEDPKIMTRPPRNLHQTLFNFRSVLVNLLQGISVLLATLWLYVHSMNLGRGEMEVRSVAFASLVIANIFLILINQSWNKSIFEIIRTANRTLIGVVAGAIVCLLVVLNFPPISSLFHVQTIRMADYGLIFLVIVASLSWFELLKLLKNTSIFQKLM